MNINIIELIEHTGRCVEKNYSPPPHLCVVKIAYANGNIKFKTKDLLGFRYRLVFCCYIVLIYIYIFNGININKCRPLYLRTHSM